MIQNIFHKISRLFGKANKPFSPYKVTRDWCNTRGISLDAHDSVGSTNDLAKTEAFDISEDLKIYLADQQSRGRGRHERHWLNAAPGSQLLCTWSFKVHGAPQAITAPLVGLSAFRALTTVFPNPPNGLAFSLKAPNDIYLGQKKIAGILVESLQKGSEHRLLIGFGLNVWDSPKTVDFAGNLSDLADLNSHSFQKLLNSLWCEFEGAARSALGPHLTESQRQALAEALNAREGKTEVVTQVSPFGDIVTASQTTSWRDL